VFKGYVLPDHSAWWQIFYYRFVSPEARAGEHLNYRARIQDAHAVVLPSEWVFYFCPARKGGARPGPSP